MEMPPKFATAYLDGGDLIVLLQMSYADVNSSSWGVYLMALPQMSYGHVNCSWQGGISEVRRLKI